MQDVQKLLQTFEDESQDLSNKLTYLEIFAEEKNNKKVKTWAKMQLHGVKNDETWHLGLLIPTYTKIQWKMMNNEFSYQFIPTQSGECDLGVDVGSLGLFSIFSEQTLSRYKKLEDDILEDVLQDRKRNVQWGEVTMGKSVVAAQEYEYRIPNQCYILEGVIELEPKLDSEYEFTQRVQVYDFYSVKQTIIEITANLSKRHLKQLLKHIELQAIRLIKTNFLIEPIPIPNQFDQLDQLFTDNKLAQLLRNRWKEANLTFQEGAYLSTVILLGSILEGILFAKVELNPREANTAPQAPKDEDGNVKAFTTWKLTDLIEVAQHCGWIRKVEDKVFIDRLRYYRNFIHPKEQIKQAFEPDRNICNILWTVLQNAINDLIENS